MQFTQCLFTKRFQGDDAGSQDAEMKATCNTCYVISDFSATYEFLHSSWEKWLDIKLNTF